MSLRLGFYMTFFSLSWWYLAFYTINYSVRIFKNFLFLRLKKRPKATKATNIVAFQNFLCRFCRPSKKRQKATSSFVGGHPRLGGSTQKTYLHFFASCVKLIFLKNAVVIFFTVKFTDFEALGGSVSKSILETCEIALGDWVHPALNLVRWVQIARIFSGNRWSSGTFRPRLPKVLSGTEKSQIKGSAILDCPRLYDLQSGTFRPR